MRDALAGRSCERPPIIAAGITLAARLAQIRVDDALLEPQAITTGVVDAVRTMRLDGVTLDVPRACFLSSARDWHPEEIASIQVLGEVIRRVRALLRDSAAVLLALPGPWYLSAEQWLSHDPTDLTGVVDDLLPLVRFLSPECVDGFAVVEGSISADADLTAASDALVPLWNFARHFAVPSLFIACDGPAGLVGIGADAIAVSAWTSHGERVDTEGSRIGRWLTGGHM